MNERLRSLSLLTVRWAALAGLTVWLGGFTFYSAVVIPLLHDELGGPDAGAITGKVTDPLNAFGVAAVAAWWVMTAFEGRAAGSAPARAIRRALLALTTAILLGLIALHPVLDARLASGSMRDFYRLHQVYLIASTVQWGVNLALLAATLWVWQGTGTAGTEPKSV
jgi:hypothetical protein